MPHDIFSADPAPASELPCGFKLLQGQYQIERPLLSGGFGITYLARDSLERRVVIKECYPAGLCRRSGTDVEPSSPEHARSCRNVLRAFLREAHLLARARHPAIVGVHQVFKENQTAYIAMEFIDGLDLLTVREEQPERLTGPVLRRILDQSLEALDCLHRLGVLHRDISPDNILLGKDGTVTLIDFGAACGSTPDDSTALPMLLAVKDGYSAHELYSPDLPQRPACDLYALGATLYYLITGAPPAASQKRLAALLAGSPDPCRPLLGGPWAADPALLATVDMAMSVLPAERFQSASGWAAALAEEVAPQQAVDPQTTPAAPAAAAACADDGSRLAAAISELVAKTNDSLKPGLPRSARQAQTPPAAPPAGPRRPLVNIFGEPVTDLEAWLEEEDAISWRKKIAPSAQQPPGAAPVPLADPSDPALGLRRDKPTFAGRLRRIFGRPANSPQTVKN
ncbi:serine/threonine protein kinase [Leisingera aquaemixtae]|uniref:non-specific serine/threonine protein kinase n=1 Tax=Leisingera aquaemixtae TaxID=1396826 RepID=A0A0P1H8N8_9RHOB|nr:serine/threonine-protein kinase [Leisingera aquaemixtae]CUH99532.1 Serine/threonine-protein kinase C [Leisingera aquaemixtae]